MFQHNSDLSLNLSLGSDANDLFFLTPKMCDIDGDGDLDLMVGSIFGSTLLIYNDQTLSSDQLCLIPFDFFQFGNHYFANPAPVDIDGDGDLDMFIGESDDGDGPNLNFFPGRIGNFEGTESSAPKGGLGVLIDQSSSSPFGMIRYSGTNSTMVDIDDDGDVDMFHLRDDGTLFFQENVGTRFSPSFGSMDTLQYSAISFSFGGESPGHIAFADFDYDGDLDAIVQDTFTGYLRLFPNQPTSTGAFFSQGSFIFNPGNLDLPDNSDFSFIDLDEDGDLDVFYTADGYIGYAKNFGAGAEGITLNDFSGIYYNVYELFYNTVIGAPQFVDLDYDGDYECILAGGVEAPLNFLSYSINSSDFGSIAFNESESGTLSFPVSLANPEHINFVDIDSDGDLDLFATSEEAGIYFLENINCAYDVHVNHFLPHRSLFTSYNDTRSAGQVPPGRDIIMEGAEVNLVPGFEVKKDIIAPIENPTFLARIGGCSEEFDLPVGGESPSSIVKNRPDIKEKKSTETWGTNKVAKNKKKIENLAKKNLENYPLLQKLLQPKD